MVGSWLPLKSGVSPLYSSHWFSSLTWYILLQLAGLFCTIVCCYGEVSILLPSPCLGSTSGAGFYVGAMNILFPMLAFLYISLCAGRTTHSIPRYLIPDTSTLSEPYESINLKGELAVCHNLGCNGAWKPPKAHHCSTCGVCRLEFDHHCPWVSWCHEWTGAD